MAVMVYGADNVACHALRGHEHGIAEGAFEQVGIHEAWADIGEADVQSSLTRLLFENLQIRGLQGLGGRVRRSGAESLGASDRRNGSNMSGMS